MRGGLPGMLEPARCLRHGEAMCRRMGPWAPATVLREEAQRVWSAPCASLAVSGGPVSPQDPPESLLAFKFELEALLTCPRGRERNNQATCHCPSASF